ncbi:MAG: tRNA (adenosine(37)-N6)-threonylcarbamoyltransferase complex ATPase subunit type 1 TsaE [Deltaproteobacteria bacterium]|nr:tRNA (adenosine(37)-N6)-threonylcarbamoyltransferase complex ATPase subunit type 1 TsaE [Deltaproteobacteria bacterium]MCB9786461.1 tRNA (adenosine(37)-N6)-threonylcarbamoyltransferase complex ATPase subunit type 1 TsaE [Deltaproteobacteria bacterium]
MEASVIIAEGEGETAALGRVLAGWVMPGDLVTLAGELGAGKTTLVRAMCAALEVPREAGVSSPSYALVNVYEGGRFPVAHVDLYRLADDDELESIGFRDLLDGEHVVLVEWPERAAGLETAADLRVRIEDRGPAARSVEISAADPGRRAALERLLART